MQTGEMIRAIQEATQAQLGEILQAISNRAITTMLARIEGKVDQLMAVSDDLSAAVASTISSQEALLSEVQQALTQINTLADQIKADQSLSAAAAAAVTQLGSETTKVQAAVASLQQVLPGAPTVVTPPSTPPASTDPTPAVPVVPVTPVPDPNAPAVPVTPVPDPNAPAPIPTTTTDPNASNPTPNPAPQVSTDPNVTPVAPAATS